jgi:protoheme ferro-lyase
VTHGLDLSLDAVQTAAIILLTGFIVFGVLRSDKRLAQQHRDIQDVILGQYSFIKQLHEQQTQIDMLAHSVEEKCGQLDQRIIVLEIPAHKSA